MYRQTYKVVVVERKRLHAGQQKLWQGVAMLYSSYPERANGELFNNAGLHQEGVKNTGCSSP